MFHHVISSLRCRYRISAKLSGNYGLVVATALAVLPGLVQSVSASTLVAQSDVMPPVKQIANPLFFTQSDVLRWQARAEHGPYRVKSDVVKNSPGDWQRVEKHYRKFMGIEGTRSEWPAPTFDYVNNVLSSCYLKIPYIHDNHLAAEIRDTAFYGRVKEDNNALNAAKQALLALATHSTFDFTQSELWCPGEVNDGRFGFHFAEWMTRLVVAYDFMRHTLTFAEQQQILLWFKHYAYYARKDLKKGFINVFKNRDTADYELLTQYDHEQRFPVVVADPYHIEQATNVARIGYFYNNRRGQFARVSGLIGLLTKDNELLNDGVQYCHEYLMFGVSPEGYPVEFERNRFSHREVGFQYSMQTLGQCLTLASAMARQGDNSLFEFSTLLGPNLSTGELEMQSAPADFAGKSLEFMAVSMVRHLDGTHHRYQFIKPDANNPFVKHYDAILTDADENLDDYLIDGYEPAPKSLTKNSDGIVTSFSEKRAWYSVADSMLAEANQFLHNPYLRDIYLRTASNVRPYPGIAAGFGAHYGFGGESAIYPGVMFMFAQAPASSVPVALFNAQSGEYLAVTDNVVVINQDDYPQGFSLVVNNNVQNWITPQVGNINSVEFYIDDTFHRLENIAPFSLHGDNRHTPYGFVLAPGSYRIHFSTYPEKGAKGTKNYSGQLQLIVQ